jgi:hypothetical protein
VNMSGFDKAKPELNVATAGASSSESDESLE